MALPFPVSCATAELACLKEKSLGDVPNSALPLRGAKGALAQGAAVVWRQQAVLWWIFVANLLLALVGTIPVALRIAPILDHSLAAERLVKGFDVAVLLELALQPSHPFNATAMPALLSLVFLVFMVFVEGGLLKLYWLDRKLTAGQFFEDCGGCFWRLVRLFLLSLIGFVPLFLLAHFVVHWSGRLSENAPEPRLGFWVETFGLLVALFLLTAVRLWFDMAQIQVVVEDQPGAIGALRRALRLTRRNFFPLFWLYLRPSLVGWAVFADILWFSVKFVPPQAIGASFLLGELALLVWLGTRLWQRAGEIAWYWRYSFAETSSS
jgi:hypothetical protein